jgi:hypothetical protein
LNTRRGLLLGLGAVIAAPAIVRYGNIMPVRELAPELLAVNWPHRGVRFWCDQGASLQTWESFLADLKTLPDDALFKEVGIGRAEYWVRVKRQVEWRAADSGERFRAEPALNHILRGVVCSRAFSPSSRR